jgi:glucose-6-phosphate 1-dehydrogenase
MDIVIFGISGDLAQKKLLPALRELKAVAGLPRDTRIIGFSRTSKDFGEDIVSVVGDYSSFEDFQKLKKVLRNEVPVLFYFAIPPEVYGALLQNIYDNRLLETENSKRKILIEKPFGLNLKNAVELKDFIEKRFDNEKVLLVDHYAGKTELRETEVKMNLERRKEIESLEIRIWENSTVEGRSDFYDKAGALFDVGQNHLLYIAESILCADGEDRSIVAKQLKYVSDGAVFGQYNGYDSAETFFRIKARFRSVDITLMSGKGLRKNESTIKIKWKDGAEEKILLQSGTEAYKNIFRDAISGQKKYFLSYDEVLFNWNFIEMAKKDCMESLNNGKIIKYDVGSLPEDILNDIS